MIEHPTLLLAGAVAWTVGGVYLYVASALGGLHGVDARRQSALTGFRLWWAATGFNIVIGGTIYVLAGVGVWQLELQVAYALFQRLILAVSLAGLIHYFAFIVTGRGLLGPVVAYYVVYFLFLAYGLVRGEPTGVYIGTWRTDLENARPHPPAFEAVGGLLILVPPIAGCIGALVLSRKLRAPQERSRRIRLRIVATAVLVWWIIAVVAGQREARGFEEFQFINRFAGLLAAIAVLFAFRPPLWARRRWGLHSYPA